MRFIAYSGLLRKHSRIQCGSSPNSLDRSKSIHRMSGRSESRACNPTRRIATVRYTAPNWACRIICGREIALQRGMKAGPSATTRTGLKPRVSRMLAYLSTVKQWMNPKKARKADTEHHTAACATQEHRPSRSEYKGAQIAMHLHELSLKDVYKGS